ncbi:hypothetical protein CCACVL1_23721 [Corchorus capsularis]|uniref:protein-serine/threonine phosphatase n=1 Tax=Corchorus capsularis TaxID=210143 RepID=A0A1R3GT42_COCAP|nr:hypothetical protein CCACVL1_23721 [Corchorus capsularis]
MEFATIAIKRLKTNILTALSARPYAKKIAQILDPQGIYFGHRIISRDDNPLAASKAKTLDLVLAQESKILILDDNFGPRRSPLLALTELRPATVGDENQTGNSLRLPLLSVVLSAASGGLKPCKSTLAGCFEAPPLIRVADRQINSTLRWPSLQTCGVIAVAFVARALVIFAVKRVKAVALYVGISG